MSTPARPPAGNASSRGEDVAQRQEGSPVRRRRALFLDRDGVINVDHAYVHRREHFEFVDGIFELCAAARRLGYLLVVVTNQAGIGRGYYSEDDFHRLTEWMRGVFSAHGAPIDGVYFCPFHPEHGIGEYRRESPFRKPGPGMILQAASELDIDLPGSVLVGDKMSDIDAGIAAGVGTRLLFAPAAGGDAPHAAGYATIAALVDAMRFLSASPVQDHDADLPCEASPR